MFVRELRRGFFETSMWRMGGPSSYRASPISPWRRCVRTVFGSGVSVFVGSTVIPLIAIVATMLEPRVAKNTLHVTGIIDAGVLRSTMLV